MLKKFDKVLIFSPNHPMLSQIQPQNYNTNALFYYQFGFAREICLSACHRAELCKPAQKDE